MRYFSLLVVPFLISIPLKSFADLTTKVLVVLADSNYDLSKKTVIIHPTEETLACLNKMIKQSRYVISIASSLSLKPEGIVTLALEVVPQGKSGPGRGVSILGNSIVLAGRFVPDNPPEAQCTYPGQEGGEDERVLQIPGRKVIDKAISAMLSQAAAYNN